MSTSPSSAASAAIASRVADVEDAALDAGDRRAGGDGGRGGADAVRVAAGEQDAVLRRHARGEPFDERAAESLVGAGDEGGAGSGHAVQASAATSHASNEDHAQLPCVNAWLRTSPRPGCGSCARSRKPGSFSAAAHSLGYTQSAVSRQVAALEAVAGRRLFDATPPGRRR